MGGMAENVAIPPASTAARRFWALGSDTHDVGAATLTAHPGAPSHPLGTVLHDLRPREPDDLDAALHTASAVLGCPCPRILVDDAVPHWARARLAEQGWRIAHELHLLLPAAARLPGDPDAPVRPPDHVAPAAMITGMTRI